MLHSGWIDSMNGISGWILSKSMVVYCKRQSDTCISGITSILKEYHQISSLWILNRTRIGVPALRIICFAYTNDAVNLLHNGYFVHEGKYSMLTCQ